MGSGPEYIYGRFQIGILELDDVAQTFRADMNVFFYFNPIEKIEAEGEQHVRFENISKPSWVPHFDFANEFDTVVCTDESFWLDTKTGLVFGRMNWIPSIQERFDHQRFPFDRQIIDIQMMMNNCQLKKWELDSINEYPPELSMDEPDIVAITELNAAADAWDLKTMLAHTVNDPTNKSSIVHFQVFLERASTFYFWNIVMVYFIIISLQVVLIAFPYNETRFEFSLTLALTTVAFMFVTTAMVPKTTYLTFMDKYMLSGLLVLFLRFGVDLAIQLVMEEELPFNDISGRASCTEENANSFGLTPCFVDAVATAVLTGFWLIYSVFIALCTFVFPGLIRMKWEKINKKVNNVSRQNKERAVVKKFITENRVIRSGDISDAVNYTASNEQMKSSI